MSDLGRIRRTKVGCGAIAGKVLTPKVGQSGYLEITLHRNGKRTYRTVHSLIAEAFIGNRPSPGHQVNHKDTNKLNPDATNLEYLTGKENMAYAAARGLLPRGSRHAGAKLTEESVAEIRRLLRSMGKTEIGRRFGVHRLTIRDIEKRKVWKQVA